MPTYRVKASNGRTYRVEGPEDADPQALIGYVDRLAELEAIRNAEITPPKEEAGFLGSLADSATTMGMSDEAAAYMANQSEENRRALIEAGESKYGYAPGFGEGENWRAFKELLGGSLGQWVAPLAATGATLLTPAAPAAPAVGFATRAAQFSAQNALRQAQEQQQAIDARRPSEEFSLGRNITASLVQAGLDELQIEKVAGLLGKFPTVSKLFGRNVDEVAEVPSLLEQAVRNGNGSFTGNVFRGVAKNVAFEVPQEVAQTFLERWSAGLPSDSPEAIEEYKQAAIGAAILGPAMGAVEGAVETAVQRSGAPAPLQPPAPPGGANNVNVPPPPVVPSITAPPDGGAAPVTPTAPPSPEVGGAAPTSQGGLPPDVQAGIDLANQFNQQEQERVAQEAALRQQQEAANQAPLPPPVSPTGGMLSGLDALYYLANVAEREGVDLTKLNRTEYVEYAVQNGVALSDSELRESPKYRSAKNIKEMMAKRAERFAEAAPYEQQSNEFARAMDSMPTRYGPKTVPGFHDGVRASSQNKNSNSWFHFYINNAKPVDTAGVTKKGYLGFTNAAASLTADRFKGYLNALADAGYNGQVKSIQDTIGQSTISDQVVFHGASDQDVELAHQIAEQYFGDEINFRDSGYDLKGKSYSQWLAEDARKRAKAVFDLRQQQARLAGGPSGQGNLGGQQNQGLPSGQPNATGSGAGPEVSAQREAASPTGQAAEQAEPEGLDDNQRSAGEPPVGTLFKRITLTPAERAADNKAVLDAFNASGGKITRAELRRATGIDNDARLDAARTRLKTAGTPIPLTTPRMTPQQRQERKQERIEEEQRRKREMEFTASGESVFTEEPATPQPSQPKAGALLAKNVEQLVANLTKGWKNAPRIIVVQSIKELPGDLKNIPEDTAGLLTEEGDVIIIADNATSESSVKGTLFHESLGHFGLRARYGKGLNALLLDMYNKHVGLRKAVDAWLKANPDTYAKLSKEKQIANAMEEVFAEYAEQDKKNIWVMQALQRIAAYIRSFLRDMGLLKNYSASDIMEVVRQSREAVTEGKNVAPEMRLADSVLFQRKTNVLPMSYFGKKTGTKPSGSNPGAIYENVNGEKWLLKGNIAYSYGKVNKTESDDRAKNEVLASKLYRAVGLNMPEMQLVNLNGEYESAPNGLGVASTWLNGLKDFNPDNPIHRQSAWNYYAVSAWLGNYDVIGTGFENLKVDADGDVWHIDPGGSLLFRAQGLLKDQQYGVGSDGMLSPDVPEWESMRSTNVEQQKVFGSAPNYDLEGSAYYLNNISPDQIKDIVSLYAQGDADFKKRLAENLIARREAIIQKAGIKDLHAKGTAKKKTKAPVAAPVPASAEHSHPDDNGNIVTIDNPSVTLLDDLNDPDGWATWAAQDASDYAINTLNVVNLNGTEFTSVIIPDPGAFFYNLSNADEDRYLNKNLNEPEFKPKAGLKSSAGVIIVEPDGRVWTVQPTNQFGGYNITFPKGGIEGDTYNLEMQMAAVREAFEETGLLVKITGFLGDYDRSTSRTRYYIAERVAGKPFNMGWESQAVTLAPPSQMVPALNNEVDKTILNNYIATTVNFGPSTTPAAPAPSASKGFSKGFLKLNPQEKAALNKWSLTKEYTDYENQYITAHGSLAWNAFTSKVAKAFVIAGLGTENKFGKKIGESSFSIGGKRQTTYYVDTLIDYINVVEHGDSSSPAVSADMLDGFTLDQKYNIVDWAIANLADIQVVPGTPSTSPAPATPATPATPAAPAAPATPAVDPLALDAKEQDALDRWKKTKEYKDLRTTYVSKKGTPAWENFERKVAKVLAAVGENIGYTGATNRYSTFQTDDIVSFVETIEKGKPVNQAANDYLSNIGPVAKQKAIKFMERLIAGKTTTTATPTVDPLTLDATEQGYLDRYKKVKEYSDHKSYWAPSAWADIERKIAKVAAIIELRKFGFSSGSNNRFSTTDLDRLYTFVVAAETTPADPAYMSGYGYSMSKLDKAVNLLNVLNGHSKPSPNATNRNTQRYNSEGVPFDNTDVWSEGNTAVVLGHLGVDWRYGNAGWQKAEQLIRNIVAQRNETGTEAFQTFYSASKIRQPNNQPLLGFRATGYEITSYDGATDYTHIPVIFASPFANVAIRFGGNGPYPRMYGIWINMTNPWDYRIKRHVEALMKHLKDTDYFNIHNKNETSFRADIERGDWTYLESKPLLSWIADHHDGMIMSENGSPDGLTYGIFGDPKRRNEEGFRARDQIKSATGNDGNYGLYTGDIRFQRVRQNGSVTQIGANFNRLPLATNSLMEGIRNAISKVPDALRQAYLGFLSLPQIAELYGKRGQIPSLHDLVKLLEERAATLAARTTPINANIRKWAEIAKAHAEDLPRFYDIAMRTTINQIDVLDRAMANDPLTQEFNTLPAELRQVYRELRESYKHQSDELIDRVLDNIPASEAGRVRAEYEAKRLKVYLPLFREGDYWLTYQDENNETVTRAFGSPRERQMAVDALADTGARDIEVYGRLTQIPYKERPPEGFVGDIIKKVRANMEANNAAPDDIDAMVDTIYATMLDYMPAESLRQMFRNNPDRGVLGFETDVFQVYANVAKRMANQLNTLQYAKPMEEIMSNIRVEAGGQRAPQALRDVVQNITAQMDFLRNPINGPTVNRLSYFSYFWNIAGNISSAIVNLSQVPAVVFPLLAGKYDIDKAAAALKKAGEMYFRGGRDDSTEFMQDFTFYRDDLDQEYKDLFNFAVGRSAIRRPTGYEVTEARQKKVEDYTGLRAKIEHGLGFMFQNTERFNREITLLAAYDLAKQSGMNEEQAREEALRLVTEAHGTSLVETGPRFFQTGIGKVAFTFKRFAQSQIYLLSKLFYTAFKGEDELTRKTAMKQILGVYGSAFAFAGVQGMPLYGAGSMLVNLIMAFFDDDEPFDPDEMVRSAIGDLGYKGPINQLLNIDIASRTGFNNLIWRDDPRRLAEVGPALYAVESFLGPAYSTGRGLVEGGMSVAEGDYQRGFESMAPSFIRNTMKSFRYATEGATNRDGIAIVEDVNAYNQFMQILGFTPADLAEARARANAMKSAERAIIDRRTALLDLVYSARKEGDIDGVIDAMEEIRKFSALHPQRGYAITSDTINRSYKAKQAKERGAVDGVYIDKNLAPYLKEEYGN